MSSFTPTRRGLLTGGGVLLATPALIAAGATPAAATIGTAIPLRSLHRFHLGAMTLTVIDDARFTFPAPMFAINQPEGAAGALLSRYGLPEETVSLHLQITLVEVGDRKVLLDTGLGDVVFPGNPPDGGRMFAGLAAIGVDPDTITDVILSHGHPDHLGAVSMDGVPCFRNATYHIAPEELEFWSQKPGDEQDFFNLMLGVANQKLAPLEGMIQPYADGEEVVPGITAIAARGHTVGHYAFLLADGDARLLHLMDTAVHYIVGPEEPDWAMGVEMDTDAAAATRRRLFAQAAEQNLLVAGYHFPFPGLGRIIDDGNAWRYVPVPTA